MQFEARLGKFTIEIGILCELGIFQVIWEFSSQLGKNLVPETLRKKPCNLSCDGRKLFLGCF